MDTSRRGRHIHVFPATATIRCTYIPVSPTESVFLECPINLEYCEQIGTPRDCAFATLSSTFKHIQGSLLRESMSALVYNRWYNKIPLIQANFFSYEGCLYFREYTHALATFTNGEVVERYMALWARIPRWLDAAPLVRPLLTPSSVYTLPLTMWARDVCPCMGEQRLFSL